MLCGGALQIVLVPLTWRRSTTFSSKTASTSTGVARTW